MHTLTLTLKKQISQVNKYLMHINLLEKQEQTKHKTSIQKSGTRSMISGDIYIIDVKSMKQKVGTLKRLTRLINP
jgi:hypothetical protein